MQNQRMLKQIARATMEGTRKTERRRRRRKEEAEFKYNGNTKKGRQAIVRDRREWRKFVLQAKGAEPNVLWEEELH
jgi:hypothetical protein